jgi:mRNA interferase MazF
MTASEPGDVLLIPFPFTDFSTLKQRPCIVLSSSEFNRTHQDVIVAAITSHLPATPANDEYRLSPSEQRSCGLPKGSMVKLGKIVTIDRRLVRRSLGHLPGASLHRVLAGVRSIFGGSMPARRSARKRG